MIRIHSRVAGRSTFLVEMSLSTFPEDALFWRSHKDLGDGIEDDDNVGFERGEGVAEVDQRCDEDEDVEDERAHVIDGHDGGEGDLVYMGEEGAGQVR